MEGNRETVFQIRHPRQFIGGNLVTKIVTQAGKTGKGSHLEDR